MYNYDRAFNLHFELTNKCNSRCILCPRTVLDNDIPTQDPNLNLSEITLDNYKKIFYNNKNDIRKILLCGNLGDPIIAKDIFEITEYSLSSVLNKTQGKFDVRTNGSLRTKKWWSEYGKLCKGVKPGVVFGIDGLKDTSHIYRVNTSFEKVIENAAAFIEQGGVAIWQFIIFKHNVHQLEDAKELARKMGFHNFLSFNNTREEKINYVWKGKNYTLENFDTNMTEPHEDGKIHCLAHKNNMIYIDSFGNVFPCCWVPVDLDHDITMNSFIKEKAWDKDFIKILQNDWFSHILPMSFESFPIPMCKQVCSKKSTASGRSQVESTASAHKYKERVVEMGGLGSREYIKL